ncbi:MAG: hypothetical protein JRI68_21285 [Deltaproteobacteria bacterium]|nr:hypothetical protein [Deltaproteobacteria bacterium]
MAKECVRCGKKIGFFKKTVDGAYCSEACSEEADKENAAEQAKADALRDEAKRRVAEEAEREKAVQQETAQQEKQRNTCPKCGKGWQHTPAATEGDAQKGQCAACGLQAEFTAIEACPNCRAEALLISPDGSKRCPRCKFIG